MGNFTEGGNATSSLNQAISLPAGIDVFLSALNIFLSFTASLGNALILIALRKVTSVHPPTKLLFRSLAVTDLCVGLIVQPLFATTLLDSVTNSIDVNILYYFWEAKTVLGFVLCGVSVFTSTAISVDRLFALLLGLQYRHVVTLRRVRAVIIYFWLIGISGGFFYLYLSRRNTLNAATIFTMLCVFISVFCYAKIFLKLRQHRSQVQELLRQGQPPNEGGTPALSITRYKRTVSSIAWVQLALVVCYVPFIAVFNMPSTSTIALNCTRTLFYLNSSLNPFLYYWKIKGVRQAVKGTVKQFCCLSS